MMVYLIQRMRSIGVGMLAVMLALTLLPVGNLASAAETAQSRPTRVRVVHAIPDAPAVDVYVNGNKTVENLAFFTVTDYLTVAPGTFLIQVVPAGAALGTDTIVFQRNVKLKTGDYSIIARGTLSRADSVGVGATQAYDRNTPAEGQARVRVAHFAPDAPAVDIYVNGARVIEGITFYELSDYLTVPAGSYTVGVAPAGGDVIYTTSVTLAAGQVATAWANGLLGGSGDQAFKVTASIDQ